MKRFLKLPEEARSQFLMQDVDLDFISETLSNLGITKKTFMFPPTEKDALAIPMKAVIDLEFYRKKQSLPKKTLILWLCQLGGFDSTKTSYAVDTAIKTYMMKQRKSHRDMSGLSDFLDSCFEVKNSKLDIPVSASPAPAAECSHSTPRITETTVI
ncbi:hypothetical protein ElyMa_002442400 [Elysia marginata]|uniref:DM2 domain-containing protein n=1 Tax=Elysia marginata TaxID=1093978 RepID=A0AAV4GIY4_9GAST|nr:hypothetical protein ElyMa_002442400 [Elysia marginata]